jgi:hypothetical protein
MTIRQLPDSKRTIADRPDRRPRQSAPDSRIVHELINQLSVLNLISFKISIRLESQANPSPNRDLETLKDSIRDATRLCEEIARQVDDQLHPSAPAKGHQKAPGAIVRRLYSVPNPER